ncbi:pyrroline-5-carboxylate reductase [Candidatus Poribacteria bacterium]|nr:pyrroline-5-carboxylate reductase [Candidatus Poribacteria bacterium]
MAMVGFIGVGNMGMSILKGGLSAGVLESDSVLVFDALASQTAAARQEHGVRVAASLEDLVAQSDWIVFSAKPQNVAEVLPQVARHVRPGQWLLSIAAGVRTRSLEGYLPAETPVVRVMPNIAASVSEAATAICPGASATEEHLVQAERLFEAVGVTARLSESLMDVVTGLSGSGPAFAFLVIEALADAGVQNGLTFAQARVLAAQTLLGAAKMLLSGDAHPAQLKTMVTSPGGTTAAGLAALERLGLRAALAEAVTAATERSRELGKVAG